MKIRSNVAMHYSTVHSNYDKLTIDNCFDEDNADVVLNVLKFFNLASCGLKSVYKCSMCELIGIHWWKHRFMNL